MLVNSVNPLQAVDKILVRGEPSAVAGYVLIFGAESGVALTSTDVLYGTVVYDDLTILQHVVDSDDAVILQFVVDATGFKHAAGFIN